MNQVVIENPVINSPFEEPQRHFRFTDSGITDEIIEQRRTSSYFIPVAPPKMKGRAGQGELDYWTQDRLEENTFINRVRDRIAPWRQGGYQGVTPSLRQQSALRADIDEAAWASLYSTVNRPFDRPKTGKIAIKVINHYGDEVLKVYEVG